MLICGSSFNIHHLYSGKYKTGIKVTDEELGQVNIIRNAFQGNWNDVIAPTNYI